MGVFLKVIALVKCDFMTVRFILVFVVCLLQFSSEIVEVIILKNVTGIVHHQF